MFTLGIKNSGLYSDLFYKYQDYKYQNGVDEPVAIYSSQSKILGYLPSSLLNNNSVYSTKYALIMYRKGKAGTLFVPKHKKWACSENAIPMLLKEQYRNKIILDILIILIQDEVYEKSTGKADNANANWNMIKDMEVDYNYDDKVISQYSKIAPTISKCKKLSRVVDRQLKKSVTSIGKEMRISDIFHVTSGIRITEKDVYEHEGNLPCVASQTTGSGITWRADERWLETFKKNRKSVIVNSSCITWTKDGYRCGKLFYRNYKFYPNDHCGVLLPKDNKINLKWFIYTQQQLIYPHVTSKTAQGMLYEEQMANIKFIFPDENKENSVQNNIVKEYEKLQSVKEILSKYKSELLSQSSKIVV
jgi:hypothetical protein